MKRDEHNSEPLDAILRRAGTLSPGVETPECADPEKLAAYFDRTLDPSERDRLDAHFADCARCQMQLAAIARADERASEARPALGIAWLRRWQVALPALAAVAAVVVVIAVMRPRNDESRRDFQIAMAKRKAPLMDLAERAPAPASPPASEVASAPEAVTNRLETNEAKPAAPGAHERREELGRNYDARTIGRAGAMPNDKGTAALAAKSSEIGAMASAPMMNRPSGPANGRAAGGGASAIGGAVAAPETLVMIWPIDRPPISAQTVGPTWMAGKHGRILFRDADGNTRSQHSGVDADLTAGAAPSTRVCWIVGRRGTILRTTDGEHWTKIASPTDADLTGVAADSPQRAIVQTATGQIFATTDGGTSWSQD